jgi:hypothetical protein
MDDDIFNAIVICIAIIAPLYTLWKKNKDEFIHDYQVLISLPWLWIGVAVAFLIGLVFVIIALFKKYREIKDQRFREYQAAKARREDFEKIFDYDLIDYSSKKLSDKLNKVVSKTSELKWLTEDDKKRVKEYCKHLQKTMEAHKRDEDEEAYYEWEQKEAARREEERTKQDFERQVEEVFQFKQKEGIDALPVGKEYPEKVINYAYSQMKRLILQKNHEKFLKESAIEYYSTHSLNSQPLLTKDDEKEVFAQVRKDILDNKIEVKKKVEITYSGEKLDKDFYRAKDLDEDTKRRAVAQGFKHCRGIELDGYFCGGGFYIRKEKRESDYHFYMKQLFAELHENIEIEYPIADMIADVAFLLPDMTVALEIETGTNKTDQLAAKIPWLNEHFNEWVFVCPRDQQKKYDKLVDNKKSFCMTPKKAKEYILGYVAAIEQL